MHHQKANTTQYMKTKMKPVQNRQEASSSSCDVNIIVEGKQYGAHWYILREKSKFFEKIYRRKNEKQKSCVQLRGVSSKLIGLFLQYVYTNSLKNDEDFQLDLNEINDVLKFSIMFGLKDVEMSTNLKLEAQLGSLDKEKRMSELHRKLLQFLYVRTTVHRTSDLAKFMAHKAYTAANMECLFEVLKIVSCNGEKITMRLRLLDILITLFTVSLDQEVMEVDMKAHEGVVKNFKPKACIKSKEFGTKNKGQGKSKNMLLKPGLIYETANPHKTGAKLKRSIDHQENGVNRKFSFCQDSKKMNENKKIEGRNTNTNKISKEIECQSKSNDNNFVIRGKVENNHSKSKPSKQLCSKPVKNTRKLSPPNRGITLIKEHLERINEHIERGNAEGKRVHGGSRIPENKHTLRDNGQAKRVGNNFALVDKSQTHAVKQVVRVEENKTPEDKHVYFSEEHVFGNDGHDLCDGEHVLGEEENVHGAEEHVLGGEERVLSDQEHVVGGAKHVLGDEHNIQGNNEWAYVQSHVNNFTLAREYKEVARDKNMLRKGQVNEMQTTMNKQNDRKPSYEQAPVIITRKIRKMWTKDFHSNFPIIQSQDDKSACNKINPDQNHQSVCEETIPNNNSEIQAQPFECKEIVRERIYITGGIQKNDYFAHKAILELNPEMGTCITRGAMCTGRYNHGIAQLGDEIYIVGGNSGFFEQLRSVGSYFPEHEQWKVKSSMHEARDEFSLAVCDGSLYAIGGHNGIQDLRSVEKFSPRENSWSFVSPMRNYRAGACAVAVDDRSIYVIGGFNGQTYLTSVEQYDVTADVWIEIQPIASKRAYSCSVLIEHVICIFGGFDGQSALSSCEMYDINAGTWKVLADMHTPRMNATAVVYSGGLFVFGGECDSVFLETVECYNMKNKTWSFVHRLPQPMAGLRACVYLEETGTQKSSGN